MSGHNKKSSCKKNIGSPALYNLRSKKAMSRQTIDASVSIADINDGSEPTISDIMEILKSMQPSIQKLDTIEADVKQIKLDIGCLQSNVTTLNERVDALEDRDTTTINKCNDALEELQIANIRSEYNSRQYNVKIYNRPQTKSNETPEDCLDEVKSVLSNILEIPNVDTIRFANAHRLPAKGENRKPIIFKLSNMHDKRVIWKNIKKINKYNTGRADASKVFIDMDDLPEKLRKDKKSLLDDYKEARYDNKKPKWRFVKSTGNYCYYIGDVCYKPKVNNFTTLKL